VHVVPTDAPKRLSVSGLFSATPRYYAESLSDEMVSRIAERAPGHDVAMAMQIRAAVHLVEARISTPALFEEVELGAARRPDFGAEAAPWRRRIRHRLTWWKHRRFVRQLLGHVHGATVVSALEQAQLVGIGYPPEKVSVVPNGVIVPGVVPRRTRRRQIIYPGSVTFSANLDAVTYFVRDIWPGIHHHHPDLEFLVTGHIGEVDVAALAATQGVRFTGNLEDVAPVIAESLACVVPLRSGGGTRLKVLQAIALGTPVISTAKGIEGLDLQPEVHILLADSPRDFVARTLQVLDAPERGERLVTAALEQVRAAYTWDRSAARLDAHLERLHSRPAVHA
jgi:polysaccharide biosynthesis protein PslH